MRRYILLLLKGLGIGILGGLILSGAALLLFRFVHVLTETSRMRMVVLYFVTVGLLLGGLAGWVAGLNAVLWSIVDPVLWRTAGIIPATASRIDSFWLGRLGTVMDQVVQRTGGILRWLIVRIFLPRLQGPLDRYNAAVERFRLQRPGRVLTSQMMSYAALSLFIRPVWTFFYVAYGVVALAFMVFLGVPFLK